MEVRRSLSSRIPGQLLDGDLELGVISYDPNDDSLVSTVIYSDHLAFVVFPSTALPTENPCRSPNLAWRRLSPIMLLSPYRDVVLRAFQRHKVPLNMDVEMPTVETIRKMVQRNEGVAFLPRMCVEQELEQGTLCEVTVEELSVERKIRLVYPARRALSHASRAFLEVLKA